MTFSTILGVTEILCCLRLFLEEKTGTEIPESTRLEFLERFSAIFLSQMHKTTHPGRWIEEVWQIYLCWEIRQKSREPSFILLVYESLAALGTLFQRLLACLNFTLELEDLSYLYKRKKLFLCTMEAGQAAGDHGDEWGLTWYFLWGIYALTPTWNHSRNSLAAAETLSLKIYFHGTSLKWSRRSSQSAGE